MYPAEIVLPMKAELTDAGFDEMVTATEVYLGSPVKKMVSICLSRVRLASAIVFSYSKSLTYLMPLKINRAPID